MEKEIKLLNIFGPEAWHDPSFIVGNREGLETLRNMINNALDKAKPGQNSSVAQACMASDGEGFSANVICIDEDWSHKNWIDLAVPYSSSFATARETRENAKMPWEFKNEES